MTGSDSEVRDLGSAHHGGEHWIRERLLSAASLLLGIWLLASLLMLPTLDARTLSEWLRGASGAVPMALFIIVSFKHALDGLNLKVDPVRKALVPAGPVITAGAA